MRAFLKRDVVRRALYSLALVILIAIVLTMRRPATVPDDGPTLAPTDTPVPILDYSTPVAQISSSPTYLPVTLGPKSRLYWGALVDDKAPTSAELAPGGAFAQFESNVGKKMSILHWGQPWRQDGSYLPFKTQYFDNVRNHGSIPLLDWGSYTLGGGPVQPDFRLSSITAGAHDNYIQHWAQAAAAWGHPFFLRFDWEMNGNWQFPWSAQLNGNTPADYIAAWRHVHDLFVQAGATNVTWVWCPNISSGTTLPYASLYPGDAYVDWTCFDGYNFYPTWIGFNTVFTGSSVDWLYNSYQEMLSVAPSKPIMIGATGSLEAGDGGIAKAAWITDALGKQLPSYLIHIKAVLWFNWAGYDPKRASLVVESSTPSQAAFANAIGAKEYLANDFANLDTSPIPPPGP